MPSIYSGRGALAALFLSMLLVAGSLLWGAYDGYRAQRQFQTELAAHSVRDAAMEISEFVERQRASVAQLSEGREGLLARLAADPDNAQLQASLERLLKERFQEYHAFSLADSEGKLLTDDFGEKIGEICREDVRNFAEGDKPYAPYVHPMPGNYHYDVMVRWRDGYVLGILYVGFKLERLASLLRSNQIPGHQLLLVKASSPDLIEATSEGGRDRLGASLRLSATDMARIGDHGAGMDVEGTRWRVVDLPGAGLMDAARERMMRQMAGIVLVFLALGAALAIFARRDLRRRAEHMVRQAEYQQELERRVADRTRDLREKQAELERYVQIVETSGDLLAFLDGESRYQVANPAYAALFGQTPGAIRGLTVREVFGEEMYQLVGAYLDRAQEGKNQRFVSDRTFPDGRHHVLDVEYRAFRVGGEVRGVVVSIRDISQRVMAERALRDSELKLRAMLNTPFLFIGLLDAAGKVLQVNATALRTIDRKEIEIQGLDFWDIPWFSHDPEEKARLRDAVARGAQGLTTRFELGYRMASGEIRLMEFALQPLKDAEGKVVWLVPQGIDITERKATEGLLQRDREQQGTLRGLLETVLKGGPLEETLARFLAQLLEVSWLAILPKGGVFLLDEDGETLRLVASRNLSSEILERCARVSMGVCHCGQAAATRRLQFADCVDHRHSIGYPGMPDHGHYSLPLMLNDKLLGVLVLYLPAGFQREPVKEEFIAAVTDILASYLGRKRDEQALLDSENLTRAVMDSLSSSIAVLDGNGRIIRVNRAWNDFARDNAGDSLLGAGIGLNYLEVTRRAADQADEGALEVLNGMREVLEGERDIFTLEYPCHSPDQERWFMLQVTPLGGSIKGLVTTQTNITQRKLAELELERYRHHLEDIVTERTGELRATEERVRLILESTADGLFGMDTAGLFTFVNPVACAMLGYRIDQLIGRPVHRTIHHTHRDGKSYGDHECPMMATLRDGAIVRHSNEVFWRADGAALPVAYATHPMIRDGEIVGAVVSFTDITVLLESEAAREQALAEAERLARIRSEFLANMSHEIRTPLNAVLGLAQIGHRENEGRKTQQVFGRILDSGQLLLGIVNDILDFSKIEAGRLEMERRPYSPAEVIDQVVAVVADRAYAKGLDFRVEEAPDLPASCLGDSLRLAQVLVNLLSNAVKFTPAGRVTLQVRRMEDGILFRVGDTGIGMSGEQLGRLFTPFEQADGSTTRRFGGTGLGLAISKRLVDLMGGELDVASHLGAGTAFQVRLPLIDATEAAPGQAGGRVGLAGLPAEELSWLAATLPAWGLTPVDGMDTADLLLCGGDDMNEEVRAVLEAARARSGRVGIVFTPGKGPAPAGAWEHATKLERPLRPRLIRTLLEAVAETAPSRSAGGSRLKGIAVLGAEDNEVNRLVLGEMLTAEGARLTCLENGRVALDELARAGRGAYDIVLTDIQMPEMDGYETARGVHALDPDLPVVGVTAHAMAEERSRCLAAGMVEHLAKPLDMERLVAVILKYTRRRPGGAEPIQAVAAPASPAPSEKAVAGTVETADAIIDWVKLEARFNGKRDFVDKLARTALTSQAEGPAKLRAAAASGNFQELVFVAHALKGMGGNLMAETLRELAARTEMAARAGEGSALDLAEELAVAVERLLAALAERVG